MIPVDQGGGGYPHGYQKVNSLPEWEFGREKADSSLASPRKARLRTSIGMTIVLLFADKEVFRYSVFGTSRLSTRYLPLASFFSGRNQREDEERHAVSQVSSQLSVCRPDHAVQGDPRHCREIQIHLSFNKLCASRRSASDVRRYSI